MDSSAQLHDLVVSMIKPDEAFEQTGIYVPFLTQILP